jgi:C1A family cysteine protease
MFNLFKTRSTDPKYKPMGLILDPPRVLKSISVEKKFDPMPYFDRRNMCLPVDNQGNNPSCAGYAVAHFLETEFWSDFGYKKTFDGQIIYNEAKKVDGKPTEEGTSLDSCLIAAQNLGYIKNDVTWGYAWSLDDVKFALYHRCIIAGFSISKGWQNVGKDGKIGDDNTSWGGHGVLIDLFDEANMRIGICNQWGTDWGCQNEPFKGHAYMSYEQFNSQFVMGITMMNDDIFDLSGK